MPYIPSELGFLDIISCCAHNVRREWSKVLTQVKSEAGDQSLPSLSLSLPVSADDPEMEDWFLTFFCHTDVIVLFPFHIPIYVPRSLWNAVLNSLSTLRIIPRQKNSKALDEGVQHNGKKKYWVRFRFPMNFVTAPLIADIFLLAILAIGREEVRGGTQTSSTVSNLMHS